MNKKYVFVMMFMLSCAVLSASVQADVIFGGFDDLGLTYTGFQNAWMPIILVVAFLGGLILMIPESRDFLAGIVKRR